MSTTLMISQRSDVLKPFESYKCLVNHFIKVHSEAIRIVDGQWYLSGWNFEQEMTEENKLSRQIAQSNLSRLALESSAFSELQILKKCTFFQALNIVLRRALERIEYFYRSFQPTVKNNSRLQLKSVLTARELELSCLVNKFDRKDLLAGTANGMSRPFGDLMREVLILRNEYARLFGFSDYYQMHLASGYAEMRAHVSALRAALNTIFLQCKQKKLLKGSSDKTSLFDFFPTERKTPASLLFRTSKLLGIPESIIARLFEASDLHPRDRKNKLSAVWPIDAPFDVRSSLNIAENLVEFNINDIPGEILHEIIGHGVDFACINADLPAILRKHDKFSTEVVAMLMEMLIYEPRWLTRVGGVKAQTVKQYEEQTRAKELENTLMGLRYKIMVVEFEAEMYANPDQNLDLLFYELNREYMGREPNVLLQTPGYWSLSVRHYLEAPCYCHNYALGTAWVIQIRSAIRQKFGCFASPKVGPYLAKTRRNGLTLSCDEQLSTLAGEPFNCDAVVQALREIMCSLVKA